MSKSNESASVANTGDLLKAVASIDVAMIARFTQRNRFAHAAPFLREMYMWLKSASRTAEGITFVGRCASMHYSTVHDVTITFVDSEPVLASCRNCHAG